MYSRERERYSCKSYIDFMLILLYPLSLKAFYSGELFMGKVNYFGRKLNAFYSVWCTVIADLLYNKLDSMRPQHAATQIFFSGFCWCFDGTIVQFNCFSCCLNRKIVQLEFNLKILSFYILSDDRFSVCEPFLWARNVKIVSGSKLAPRYIAYIKNHFGNYLCSTKKRINCLKVPWPKFVKSKRCVKYMFIFF